MTIQIEPWIPVLPDVNKKALLGLMPTKLKTEGPDKKVYYPIDECVVPKTAKGILVFAWFKTTGHNDGPAFWHIGVNIGGGKSNWFSMLVDASKAATQSISYNSQTFWLPMPVDQQVHVELFLNDLPDVKSTGQVEIHGYYP